MENQTLMNELLDLAERLGIEVRHECFGGDGGGLCRLRERRVLFVDTAASLADQLDRTAAALAEIEGLDDLYILPEIRQRLEPYRNVP